MKPQAPPATFADLPAAGWLEPAHARLAAEYRPWRKFRYVAQDLGAEPASAWSVVKQSRLVHWRTLPLARAEGGTFGMCVHPLLVRPLFLIDRTSGEDLVSGRGGTKSLRKRMTSLFRRGETMPGALSAKTWMFEAAESSIMEGASATRAEALDLLRSGRTPSTVGERMILNNHHAMLLVRSRLDEPLSLELLLELQSVTTAATLEKPDGAGRLRTRDEDIRVVDTRDGSTIHQPPPADQLRPMLRSLCAFANSDHAGGEFLHPIIVACILHFMIGYIHPFVDGNGRTARAVFYWAALRSGYGLFEYLTISEVIRLGYSKYPQAFQDVEADDGDLTYFILYQLGVIEQALDRLADHLGREEEKIRRSERLLRLAKDLNLRQRLLLEHSLRHPGTEYTVKSHRNSNGITTNTARADLDDLVRRRLMTTSKRVREVIYHVSPTLKQRLARKGL